MIISCEFDDDLVVVSDEFSDDLVVVSDDLSDLFDRIWCYNDDCGG